MSEIIKLTKCPICDTMFDITSRWCPECGYDPQDRDPNESWDCLYDDTCDNEDNDEDLIQP